MFDVTNIPAKASFGPAAPIAQGHLVKAAAAISSANPDGQRKPEDNGQQTALKPTQNSASTVQRGAETVELGHQVEPQPATYCHIVNTPHGRRAILEAAQNRHAV